MKALDLPGRRRARSRLHPVVEALEGQFCLSATTSTPVLLQSRAVHLGTDATGAHLHPKHSSLFHPGIGSGGLTSAIVARDSPSTQTASTTSSSGGNGWVYTRIGNPTNASTVGQGGLALEGGGTDIFSVFQWMQSRMGGNGDFLVIRATNDTGYNGYLASMIGTAPGDFNSVATLDIPNRAAANDPAVAAIIESAGAILIGGGNQADYVNYWQGTPAQTAIDDDLARGDPLGGTSAGTDVIGQFIYSALHGTITSSEALDNPFDNRLTLDQDFIDPTLAPFLNNTIVDTHFVTRDRMGRMLAFLARIDTSAPSSATAPRGIGINEQTALEITPNEMASVVGNAGAPSTFAYSLQPPGPPQACQKNVPLTYDSISVDRVAAGGSFNLKAWQPTGGSAYSTPYEVSANNGVLSAEAGFTIY
jgi:cyanophycinase-like exopeptidase